MPQLNKLLSSSASSNYQKPLVTIRKGTPKNEKGYVGTDLKEKFRVEAPIYILEKIALEYPDHELFRYKDAKGDQHTALLVPCLRISLFYGQLGGDDMKRLLIHDEAVKMRGGLLNQEIDLGNGETMISNQFDIENQANIKHRMRRYNDAVSEAEIVKTLYPIFLIFKNYDNHLRAFNSKGNLLRACDGEHIYLERSQINYDGNIFYRPTSCYKPCIIADAPNGIKCSGKTGKDGCSFSPSLYCSIDGVELDAPCVFKHSSSADDNTIQHSLMNVWQLYGSLKLSKPAIINGQEQYFWKPKIVLNLSRTKGQKNVPKLNAEKKRTGETQKTADYPIVLNVDPVWAEQYKAFMEISTQKALGFSPDIKHLQSTVFALEPVKETINVSSQQSSLPPATETVSQTTAAATATRLKEMPQSLKVFEQACKQASVVGDIKKAEAVLKSSKDWEQMSKIPEIDKIIEEIKKVFFDQF